MEKCPRGVPVLSVHKTGTDRWTTWERSSFGHRCGRQRHKRQRQVSEAHSWPINRTWLLIAPFWKRTQILSDCLLRKYTGPLTLTWLWALEKKLLLIFHYFHTALIFFQVRHHQNSSELKLCPNKAQLGLQLCNSSVEGVQHCTRETTLFRTSANCFICLSEQSRIHQRAVLWQFSVSDQLACHWQNRNEQLEILIWPALDWLRCWHWWHVKQVFSRH